MNGISVFDSSAIIKFLDKADGFIDLTPFFRQNACFVSIITKLETLGWPDITPAEEARITDFFSTLTVLPIDGRIETETIKIRRKTTLKLPDAIIAATAIAIGAKLVSTDPHFLKCSYPALKLWQP
jgi:predicted nucleic acid-binding protein